MDSGSFVDMDAVEAPVPVVEDTIMDVDPLAEALGCAPITRLAVNDHAVAVTCCGRFRAINQVRSTQLTIKFHRVSTSSPLGSRMPRTTA